MHFGSFPWVPRKIQQMSAKMGPKLTPSKPRFQHPIPMNNIIYWWGSGGKGSSDEPVVRAHVRNLCQNRPKRGSAPTKATRVVFFTPRFYQQHIYMMLLQFASKKEHTQTFGQVAPSGKIQLLSKSWSGAGGNLSASRSSLVLPSPWWRRLTPLRANVSPIP